MAQVLCSISGIEFTTNHFQYLSLTSREHHHPIFSVTPKKLFHLTERWLEQELTEEENYLLYLALFASTNRVEFRVPSIRTGETSSIIAKHMARLASIVERIHSVGEDRATHTLLLPSFVISPDTKDLSCSGDWIDMWESAFKDYENHYKTATALELQSRKETNLERLIKNKTKDISSYSSQLASWAALAGDFPQWSAGLSKDILGGKEMSLSSYWCYIIKSCAEGSSILNIPKADIQELIEHCEEYIPHGSIFSHTLMTLLREGLERNSSFFNLGDLDVTNALSSGYSGFRILDASASVEDANKLAIIDTAPISEPKESQYPNKLAYIKAKNAWRMKQENNALMENMK